MQHLTSWCRTAGSGHQQLARQVGVRHCVTSCLRSLLFPVWRTSHAHSRRALCFGSGAPTSSRPAMVTTWSFSRPWPTPTFRLHQPGAPGARANARGKRAWSGAGRHDSAPPCGLRLTYRSPASQLTASPLHHHMLRCYLCRHHHRMRPRSLPRRA